MSLLAFVVFFAVAVPSAFGQTVSILNGGDDPASKAVESAIAHALRVKGYTVKAGSTGRLCPAAQCAESPDEGRGERRPRGQSDDCLDGVDATR
ncbi:MAG: hypothetical protein KatS3mg082_0704 [Nitrospiraceae bacterium]|nr:MAG: hypothetical protein KatS3mg082_0704 [Nitrospiraceae bacterium]